MPMYFGYFILLWVGFIVCPTRVAAGCTVVDGSGNSDCQESGVPWQLATANHVEAGTVDAIKVYAGLGSGRGYCRAEFDGITTFITKNADRLYKCTGADLSEGADAVVVKKSGTDGIRIAYFRAYTKYYDRGARYYSYFVNDGSMGDRHTSDNPPCTRASPEDSSPCHEDLWIDCDCGRACGVFSNEITPFTWLFPNDVVAVTKGFPAPCIPSTNDDHIYSNPRDHCPYLDSCTRNTLTSSDGQYHLSVQGDGNLVIYKQTGSAIWASNTVGKGPGPFQLDLEEDGLLLRDKDFVVRWASGGATGAAGMSELRMQNDGNLVIYKYYGGAVVWASGSNQ